MSNEYWNWPYPKTHGIASVQDLKTWSPTANPDPINRAFFPLRKRPGVGGTPGDPKSPDLPNSLRIQQQYNMSGTDTGDYKATDGHAGSEDYIPMANLWPQGVPDAGGLIPDNIYIQPWWQYIDLFVHNAFAAFAIPSPWWTNAGHKNGVPVLGLVFLNNQSFKDIQELLEGKGPSGQTTVKMNGNEVPFYAYQLIQVAEYYGFDGWFFNVETSLVGPEGENLVASMVAFLKALTENMPEPRQIQWYDAVDKSGYVSYQNCLNDEDKVYFEACNGIFPNYWWPNGEQTPETSASTAKSASRSPYDVYTGVQVAARDNDPSKDSAIPGQRVEAAFRGGTSVGLYAAAWSYQNSTLIPNDQQPALPITYPVYNDYLKNDEMLWIGKTSGAYTGDLSAGIGANLNGEERTAPAGLPFLTFFNTGRGTQSAVEGNTYSTRPYGHLSQQDVLPTWRFLLEEGVDADSYEIGFDYDSPFTGGASLSMQGSSQSSGALRLYKVSLPVTEQLWAAYALTASGLEVSLKLTFADQSIVYLGGFESGAEAPTHTIDHGNGWSTRQFALGEAFAGKTIVEIGVAMDSPDAGSSANLGMIQLADSVAAPAPPSAVSDLQVSSISKVTLPDGSQGVKAHLAWNGPLGDENAWYEVYQISGPGNVWLGRAYALAYDAIIPLADGMDSLTLAVLAVSAQGARQTLAEVSTVTASIPSTG